MGLFSEGKRADLALLRRGGGELRAARGPWPHDPSNDWPGRRLVVSDSQSIS